VLLITCLHLGGEKAKVKAAVIEVYDVKGIHVDISLGVKVHLLV